MQAANIPHNILVVDCGQRLFLFPNNFSRAKAEGTVPEDLLDTQVDPAAFEMAGHLILKRRQDYDAISQVRPPSANPVPNFSCQASLLHTSPALKCDYQVVAVRLCVWNSRLAQMFV